jgi:peptide/nickel transport system permease protein
MGRLMVEAVFAQDFPVIQGGGLLTAIVVTLANLAVDISYGWLDPRIRYG